MSDAAMLRGPRAAHASPRDEVHERSGGRGNAADGERFGEVLGRSIERQGRRAAREDDERGFEDALVVEAAPTREPTPPPADEPRGLDVAVSTATNADGTPTDADSTDEPDAGDETNEVLADAATDRATMVAIAPPPTSTIASTRAPTPASTAVPGAVPVAAEASIIPTTADGVTPLGGETVSTSTTPAETTAPAAGVPLDALPRDPGAASEVTEAPLPLLDDASSAAPTPAPPQGAAPPTTTAPEPTVAPAATAPAPAPADPAPADAAPIQLSRAEDLTAAIDRLRPIPNGGAVLEVEAPGLGAIKLHVAMQGDAVRIRIQVQSNTDAMAWFAREHDGLTAAARQAVPESASVDLQLQCGADDRRGGSPTPERHDDEPNVAPSPVRAAAKLVTPATSHARSLVDVIA